MEMHIPYLQTFIIHQMAYIFTIYLNPLLQWKHYSCLWKQLLCDRPVSILWWSTVKSFLVILEHLLLLNIQIDREFRGNDVLSLSLYTLLKTTKVIMFLAPYLTFCSNWLFDFLRQGYKFVDLKMTHK